MGYLKTPQRVAPWKRSRLHGQARGNRYGGEYPYDSLMRTHA